MQRLTPELVAMSFLESTVTGVISNELDFNLARRSGLVVNNISSQMTLGSLQVLEGNMAAYVAQEVDMDPDNVDIETGAVLPVNSVVISDSSRVMRHQAVFFESMQLIGVDAGAGFGTEMQENEEFDYRMLPLAERPISITNMRHNMRRTSAGTASIIQGLIVMRYVIVELTLEELGIINASRR